MTRTIRLNKMSKQNNNFKLLKYLLFLSRKKFKTFALGFILCLVSLLFIFKSNFAQPGDISRELKLKTINEYISNNNSRHACKHPTLPVYTEELDKYLEQVPPIICEKTQIDWVVVEGSYCIITSKAKKLYGDISCIFTDVIRKNDFELSEGQSTKVTDKYELIESDVVKVKCESLTTNDRWHGVLTGIRNDPIINLHSTWLQLKKSSLPINILMFGFDSLSRNHFIRKLPKTYEYLTKELDAIVLEDYNIVGDGTPQALIPILTGKNELELPDTRKRVVASSYVNVYPFIWNDFYDNGYVTGFLEDTPDTGIFTYRLKGFKEVPTDHYMRMYYLSGEAFFKESEKFCAGNTPRHQVMLNYITNFFETYKNKPKFLFGFHGELSHDSYNLIGAADEDMYNWLKEIHSAGILENTIFIFMSDHGNRFAEVRNTIQGKQEERLPFFSFIIPKWFKTKYPLAYKNVKTNANRLTTPFDIYATFKHMLNWSNFEMGDKTKRAISLFNEIPADRTCADAYIEPHWCACLDWKNISIETDLAKNIAISVVTKINAYTQHKRQICKKVYLDQIHWLQKLMPNDYFLLFQKNLDTDGFLGDFKSSIDQNIPIKKQLYQVKFLVKPSDAIFEASVIYDTNTKNFNVSIDDISRVNEYGAQANCIYDTYPNLRKFCYCKKRMTI